MKEKKLIKLYRKYNKAYFDNLLPNDVTISFNTYVDGADGECAPWDYDIVISAKLNQHVIYGTLLHEMMHMWQYHVVETHTWDSSHSDWHDTEFYSFAHYLKQKTGYQVA